MFGRSRSLDPAFWGGYVHISEIRIENFRLFGSGDRAFVLPFYPGPPRSLARMTRARPR